MHGVEERPGFDVVVEQKAHERITLWGERRLEHDRVHPVRAACPVGLTPKLELGVPADALPVQARDRAASLDVPIASLELREADGRRDVGHPVVEADDREPVAALWILALTLQLPNAAR